MMKTMTMTIIMRFWDDVNDRDYNAGVDVFTKCDFNYSGDSENSSMKLAIGTMR